MVLIIEVTSLFSFWNSLRFHTLIRYHMAMLILNSSDNMETSRKIKVKNWAMARVRALIKKRNTCLFLTGIDFNYFF